MGEEAQLEEIVKESQANRWVNNEWDRLDQTATHIEKYQAFFSSPISIYTTLAHRLPIPTKQPGVHKQNQNA
jgi:hypothetical protein